MQNDAEYPLALGYSLLVVSQLVREISPDLLLNGAKWRAVAVGFDSGDNILLGTITPTGFNFAK